MTKALSVEDLHKTFTTGFIPRKRPVLRGVSFTVNTGEIFGFLGPNGAGKTTTLKCALGLIFPDRGRIRIFDRPHLDPGAKRRLGYLPEQPYFYDYLTAAEFLDFYGQLFLMKKAERRDRTAALLKQVGLERAAGQPLRKFSRGMLQRVGLAQALINDPDLVLLDEPLGGLDPLGRKELRDIITRLKQEGKTVFLCSHILQDIEMICDRVAIVAGGRVISQGTLQDLISEKVLYTEVTLSGLAVDDLLDLGEPVSSRSGRILIKVFEDGRVDRLLERVRERRGRVISLVPRTETLEDLFVEMVKKS